MAFYATRRFNYWGQLGMLIAFCGGGFIIGGIFSFIPFLPAMFEALKGNLTLADFLKNLIKPENATALRWSQFLSSLFLFFVPPVLYAKVCHIKPFTHLGFVNQYPGQRPAGSNLLGQFLLVVVIMLASLPAVSALQELTGMLPWSKATLQHFKDAEVEYNKLVAVIARMNNFWDYLISVVVIALLPAIFEETIFRGGVQNLLSRWMKSPVLAIVITAIIFSAVHGSYLGFLSRFALGFVLGWFYYKTGNIWLNIAGHFVNNAVAVTALYLTTKKGGIVDPAAIDDHFPLWIGLVSIAVVVALFIVFDKLNEKTSYLPGEEVAMPDVINSNNPFEKDIASIGSDPQNP